MCPWIMKHDIDARQKATSMVSYNTTQDKFLKLLELSYMCISSYTIATGCNASLCYCLCFSLILHHIILVISTFLLISLWLLLSFWACMSGRSNYTVAKHYSLWSNDKNSYDVKVVCKNVISWSLIGYCKWQTICPLYVTVFSCLWQTACIYW